MKVKEKTTEAKKQEELSNFVGREVYTNQSMLVEKLLDDNAVGYEDIVNLNRSDEQLREDGYETKEEIEEAIDNGDGDKDIFEWWLVSAYLLRKLEKKGEPILETVYGSWWGRTCTGQAIKMDYVIEQIFYNK